IVAPPAVPPPVPVAPPAPPLPLVALLLPPLPAVLPAAPPPVPAVLLAAPPPLPVALAVAAPPTPPPRVVPPGVFSPPPQSLIADSATPAPSARDRAVGGRKDEKRFEDRMGAGPGKTNADPIAGAAASCLLADAATLHVPSFAGLALASASIDGRERR